MDEFDIDVCLTGHDHTYSRSYQVQDGNVIDYDLSKGSVNNPEELFILQQAQAQVQNTIIC